MRPAHRPSSRPSEEPVTPNALAQLLDTLGFRLPDEACADLCTYLGLLMRWNAAMNLVGAHTWQEAVRTLIVDSLHLQTFMHELALPPNPLCWDLGAGAGLPGIALRLGWTAGDYWMIEAREKRALFLTTVLARIHAPRTFVHRGRLEHFLASRPQGENTADVILSRAFMPWRELVTLMGDSLRPGGMIILLANTPPASEELEQSLGGRKWELHARRFYPAGEGSRVLCALQPTLLQ